MHWSPGGFSMLPNQIDIFRRIPADRGTTTTDEGKLLHQGHRRAHSSFREQVFNHSQTGYIGHPLGAGYVSALLGTKGTSNSLGSTAVAWHTGHSRHSWHIPPRQSGARRWYPARQSIPGTRGTRQDWGVIADVRYSKPSRNTRHIQKSGAHR